MEGLQVGRIVHYVDWRGLHIAAMIVEVLESGRGPSMPDFVHQDPGDRPCDVILQVFTPYEESGWTSSYYDESCAEGTWHWPER